MVAAMRPLRPGCILFLALVLPAGAFADCADEAFGSGSVVSTIPTDGTYPQKLTKWVGGILFDSNYDNGSLLDVEFLGGDSFRCTLYEEQGELGSRKYWFRFRMQGTAGRTITLWIDHGASPRPVLRIGDDAWRRMTSEEAPASDRVVLSFGGEEDEAEVAFFFPYGVAEIDAEVDRIVAASRYAQVETIGTSHQGRDVRMVTVTDPWVADAGKARVWLHSRVHAGEVTATPTMLGFLEQVTEDSETGRILRGRCIFNVVPLVNVDGVWLGHTRWDSQGIDPEREWCDVRIPEVAAMKAQVDAFMAGPNPIRVALNLHSTQADASETFFFKHVAPSVTTAFEEIEQAYIDAFDHATPLFDNGNPHTSQLDPCKFIESYFWNHWGEDVMALTYEGHFRRRIPDGAWITDDDYRELGRALAAALIEYLDLEPVPQFEGIEVY